MSGNRVSAFLEETVLLRPGGRKLHQKCIPDAEHSTTCLFMLLAFIFHIVRSFQLPLCTDDSLKPLLEIYFITFYAI